MDNLANILNDLIDHIDVLKEIGVRSVEMDPHVVQELTKAHNPVPIRQAAQATAATSSGTSRKREPLPAKISQTPKQSSPEERQSAMQNLQAEINSCVDCSLCKSRTKPVPGQGNLNSPDVMFIGPAPDALDDKTGAAFSGPSGELLSKMIEAMGYRVEDVFLTNACKCSTPNDRAPTMEEMKRCSHFLQEQIRIVLPKVIVVLGEHANKGLFHNQRTASQPQGTWTQFHGIPVMPTFHPKYILRFSNDADGQQTQLKRSVWSALKGVMQHLKK